MLNQDINRRAALARVAALLGSTTLPASALAAPVSRSTRFLAAPRYRLLEAVADTILPATDTPGARAAKVAARLDGLLREWASAATRETFDGALQRIDEAAIKARNKPFAALPLAERTTVLLAHDAAALARGSAPEKPAGLFAARTGQELVDPGYFQLKQLVIDLYYFSPEATATELVYEHVPGKFEPSIRLVAGSRPYLGLS